MSHKPLKDYFNEADLAVLSKIHAQVYVTSALEDYEKSTGSFKGAKDPVGLLFSTLLSLAIKNIFVTSDYVDFKRVERIIDDEAFNLMLQKVDEFHIPIEEYPSLLLDAGNSGISVLDKLLKYDFDVDKKISDSGLFSAYQVALQMGLKWEVTKKLSQKRQKNAWKKAGILDDEYLAYLNSIEDYRIIIDTHFSSAEPPMTLIAQLLGKSLKNLQTKAKEAESEKIFNELLDKIGDKVDLGKRVDVLQDAIIAKKVAFIEILLDKYTFDLLDISPPRYHSCWTTATHYSTPTIILELIKAYLKKQRLAKSQSNGLDLTDPQLVAYQVYINRYLNNDPERDEQKDFPNGLDLLYTQLYLLAIKSEDLQTLQFLHTHVTHAKYTELKFILNSLNNCRGEFLTDIVKMLKNSGTDLNKSPELLSAIWSNYLVNRNLHTFRYLMESGVDLSQPISYGYSTLTLIEISQFSDRTVYEFLTAKDSKVDARATTVPVKEPTAPSFAQQEQKLDHETERSEEPVKDELSSTKQEKEQTPERKEVKRAYGIVLSEEKLVKYQPIIEDLFDSEKSNFIPLFDALYLEVLKRKDIETLRFLHTNITLPAYQSFSWILEQLYTLKDNTNGKFLTECVNLLFKDQDINNPRLLRLVYEHYLQSDDIQTLSWMLDRGLDPNLTMSNSLYPLPEIAVKDGKIELFKLLSSKIESKNESHEDQDKQPGDDEDENKQKPFGAADLFPDRTHLFPTVKKSHWAAFGFKPKVDASQIAKFLTRLDLKSAKLDVVNASENVQNAYANLIKYGTKLLNDASKIQDQDKQNPSSITLNTKIAALNHFIDVILQQGDLSSDAAIANIQGEYLHLEQHDSNRGTGLYVVHSFFCGKKFENAEGKTQYIQSTVGELAYNFMKAIEKPVVVEDDQISELEY